MAELTREAKHALIEKALMGREWFLSEYVVINGARYDFPTWLRTGFDTPDNPGVGRYAGLKPPRYSASLDLCAQFEAKIMERNLYGRYIRERAKVLGWIGFEDLDGSDVSALDRMTAAERVDAAVALIQSGAVPHA